MKYWGKAVIYVIQVDGKTMENSVVMLKVTCVGNSWPEKWT